MAQAPVSQQRLRGARVQWHLAGLGELGPPNGQRAQLQVDIGVEQMHRFGDPKTGRGDQTEQGPISSRRMTFAEMVAWMRSNSSQLT